MSRKVRIFLSFIILLGLWQAVAQIIHNDVIMPQPFDVLGAMISQVKNPLFYASIMQTFMRITAGFLFAFFAALIVAFATYFYPVFADYCYPFLLVTRSVPNISYILIVLFWCSPQTSVMVISFLILFPTIYASLYQGLCDVPAAYHDLMKMYAGPRWFDIIHVYLPFLRPYMFSATSAGISLALKVGIMAEILGQSEVGIGRQINLCRLYLAMDGVFAWTIWIMLLLLALDMLIRYLQQHLKWEHKNKCVNRRIIRH